MPQFSQISPAMKLLVDTASRCVEDESFDADQFGLFATRLSAALLPANSTILVPERAPRPPEEENFQYLSQCPLLMCIIQGTPGTRSTFGIVSGYSEFYTDCILPIGSLISFSTPDFFITAKGLLITATERAVTSTGGVEPNLGQKRVRNELLDIGGEQQDSIQGEKSGSFIVDLDGVKHPTRSKKEISVREMELAFGFRVVAAARWTHLMGADLLLQPEKYYRMISEQSKTRASSREAAFESCGLADRIRNLHFAEIPEKLKYLLTGGVLNGMKDSLTLIDFESRNLPIATGRQPDVNSNANMATMLRNLEATMVVFYSEAFLGVFSDLLIHLEGFKRPLELVSADYLKHSIEVTVAKFFRVVSSQKNADDPHLILSNPANCAAYFKSLLESLASDLSNDAERARMEEHFLLYLRKEDLAKTGNTTGAKSVTASKKETERTKTFASTVTTRSQKTKDVACGHHIGMQLKAVNEKTKVGYVCAAGAACRYNHPSLKGKTDKDLHAMIALLPASMRSAMTAALEKREK